MSQTTAIKTEHWDTILYFGVTVDPHYLIDQREWDMISILRRTEKCHYEEAFNLLLPEFEESIETTRDEPFNSNRLPRGLYLLMNLGEHGTDAMIRKVLSIGASTDASMVPFLLQPEYYADSMERVMQVKKRMFIKGAKKEEEE
jgi:hypothetical protein